MQEGTRFDANLVLEAARALARRAFVAPSTALPDPFNALNGESYGSIRAKQERRVWGDENRGIMLEPLHRGFVYTTAVSINLVENGLVRQLVYDARSFDFGKLNVPANLPDIGYSGFRLLARDESSREIASFQGATFFRSAAKGQGMGAMARALAVKTADPRGEEFPVFRIFWIEKPSNDDVIVIHAIADSASATTAFRFTLRTNDVTILDTEATIFTRVAMDHIGIAPMQASFLFGPNKRRNIDDVRPAAYEVNGLQMLNGRGEWIWRPLNNPEQLQVSAFMDDNPRGFGLLQRERDFAAFQDDDQHFELRPSLWIEPIGDWGPGSVHLVEIPSDAEINDNIIAFWRPAAALTAGSETTFAYRQFWCWSPPEKPPLAQAIGFRVGRGSQARRRRCLVEFASDSLGPDHPGDIKLSLSVSPGQITAPRLLINPQRKTARVSFELDPGNESAVELRLLLEQGDKPLTETWLYRWTP